MDKTWDRWTKRTENELKNERWTNEQHSGQMDKNMDMWTKMDMWTNKWTNGQTSGQMEKIMDAWTKSWTLGQKMDRWTNKWTNGQKNFSIHLFTCPFLCPFAPTSVHFSVHLSIFCPFVLFLSICPFFVHLSIFCPLSIAQKAVFRGGGLIDSLKKRSESTSKKSDKKNVFPKGNKHVLCGKCWVACCLGKTGLVRLSRFLRKWDCFQALLAQTLCLETRQMHASEVFLVCTVYRTPTFHLFWNKLLFFDLCHKMNCRDLHLFHSLNQIRHLGQKNNFLRENFLLGSRKQMVHAGRDFHPQGGWDQAF